MPNTACFIYTDLQYELESKVLVPQLLVLSARFKLVSAIKVL